MWIPFALVAVLLALLVVLAGFQYSWLGQISDSERVRLQSRLAEDTRRFSDDFNRELQTAYFGFQAGSDVFVPGERNEFAKRYRYWLQNSGHTDLIRGIYFYKNTAEPLLIQFNPDKDMFENVSWDPTMEAVRTSIGDGADLEGLVPEPLALTLPVFEEPSDVQHVVVRAKTAIHSAANPDARKVNLPPKYGFLVIVLDGDVISKKILPELAARYFPASGDSGYSLAVVDGAGEKVFTSGPAEVTTPDSSIAFFDIKPSSFNFFARREGVDVDKTKNTTASLVVSETYESRNVEIKSQGEKRKPAEIADKRVDVKVLESSNPGVTVFETRGTPGGIWQLNIQHDAGSLDKFVANTRNRNLAVSFGILGLLAVSTILILISAQRAQALAQKQLDFVSSVSHEFRTPLAVIYSAAENLSDGVVDDKGRISSYGALIKKEGTKLSGMVEQILEFAGARSGRRRYDMKAVDASEIVRQTLEECVPQLEEAGFSVETDLAEGLPPVRADEVALSQAVGNLVSNAQKYSNGNKWIRVSVSNGDGTVRIAVEDKGIGISQEDRRNLFEPFFRASSVVDDQISGNGLGLSIVKQIVDAHRGEIIVTSEPGKGSRFEIALKASGE